MTTRHDRLLIVIRDFARRCGVPFHLEPNDYEGKRPDGELAFTRGSLLIDLSVAHPLAPSHRRLALKSLAVAEQRAKAKHAKYGSLARMERRDFVAFALETFGGLCEEALHLLKRIAREHLRPGGPPSEEKKAARMLLQVRQEIAICLQRYNAEVVAQWARLIHSIPQPPVQFVVRLDGA